MEITGTWWSDSTKITCLSWEEPHQKRTEPKPEAGDVPRSSAGDGKFILLSCWFLPSSGLSKTVFDFQTDMKWICSCLLKM